MNASSMILRRVGGAKGWAHIFPADLFDKKSAKQLSTHDVRKHQHRIVAEFAPTVRGKTAVLDYDHEQVRTANVNEWISLGRLVLNFVDTSQTTIAGITSGEFRIRPCALDVHTDIVLNGGARRSMSHETTSPFQFVS